MDAELLSQFASASAKILDHLRGELAKLQTGRASAALVEHIDVESYGTRQPIKNIAAISVPEARTIQIQPWDKSALNAIEKGIMLADIGVNPVNNGTAILLNFPPLSEERRKSIVKIAKKLGEESKIAIRQARHDVIDGLKKSGLSEDQQKGAEKKLQEKVDAANTTVDETVSKKEKDIMTV